MEAPVIWDEYRLPYPYFGGKSRVAEEVWRRFGPVKRYVEPFCGGCGVLLAREMPGDYEIINDVFGFIPNFWRAVQLAPEAVAEWCDWPIMEADLHARHRWLLSQADGLAEKLMADPFYRDPKVAGWWAWGQCQWIGNGWCDPRPAGPGNRRPEILSKGVHRKIPAVNVQGVNRQIPAFYGQGVHRSLPHTYGTRGLHSQAEHLRDYFLALSDRLRHVRVMCGDWKRVLKPSVVGVRGQSTGIFLDPPYLRCRDVYAHHDKGVAEEAYEWAVQHGWDINLSIAYCCYAGDFPCPSGWTCYEWQSNGYGKNTAEHIFFSPYCRPAKGRAGYKG